MDKTVLSRPLSSFSASLHSPVKYFYINDFKIIEIVNNEMIRILSEKRLCLFRTYTGFRMAEDEDCG
jgi:hypothetical protein